MNQSESQNQVLTVIKRLVASSVLLIAIIAGCKVSLDRSSWAKKLIVSENSVSSKNSFALACFGSQTHISLSQQIQITSLGLMQLGTAENPSHDLLYLVANSNGFQKYDLSSNKLKISDELHRKTEKELEPGELIKWIDQPVPRFFTASSTSAFLWGVPWTAFAIFWVWGASGAGRLPLRGRGIGCFPLFGMPFVCIGFWMLSNPIQVWYQAHQTGYIITDKRAISIEGGITTTIRSYLPKQFGGVYRRENSDGTGDVIIIVKLLVDENGNQSKEELGFMGIRNPKEVEKMLKELAKTAD